MKRKRLLIGILFAIFILCVYFNRSRITDRMLRVYSSMAASRVKDADAFWFSHVGIDSLYRDKEYKYCVFIKHLDNVDIDAFSVYKDSMLVITEGDSRRKELKQGYDMIHLPESAFSYLLEDREEMILCTIDSVIQSTPCKYRMRKVTKIRCMTNDFYTLFVPR